MTDPKTASVAYGPEAIDSWKVTASDSLDTTRIDSMESKAQIHIPGMTMSGEREPYNVTGSNPASVVTGQSAQAGARVRKAAIRSRKTLADYTW